MNGATGGITITALLLLAGCAGLRRADPPKGPLVHNLFFGETADPTPFGAFRLSGIPDYASLGKEALTTLAGAFEVGAAEGFDLRSAIPYLFLEGEDGNEDGFGDVVIGGLIALPGSENWRLALTLDVGLGTAEPPFPVGEILVRPGFVASGRAGSFELHLGLAGLFTEEDSAAEGFAALVCGTGRWRALLEVSGLTEGGDFAIARLTPGVGAELGPLEVLVGTPIGLTSQSPDWGVTAAVSVQF